MHTTFVLLPFFYYLLYRVDFFPLFVISCFLSEVQSCLAKN